MAPNRHWLADAQSSQKTSHNCRPARDALSRQSQWRHRGWSLRSLANSMSNTLCWAQSPEFCNEQQHGKPWARKPPPASWPNQHKFMRKSSQSCWRSSTDSSSAGRRDVTVTSLGGWPLPLPLPPGTFLASLPLPPCFLFFYLSCRLCPQTRQPRPAEEWP